MIKIIIFIGLLAVLMGGAYFGGILNSMGTLIADINSHFIAFLPSEIKVLITMIMFSMIIGIGYSFFNS